MCVLCCNGANSNPMSNKTKKNLLQLCLMSLALLPAVHAETPPEGTVWFRPYMQSWPDGDGVAFTDAATWNQYMSNQSAWVDIAMDVLPWELPWASQNQMKLKMDFSKVYLDSALGSEDKPLNVSIEGLFQSSFHIKSDLHITGLITDAANTSDVLIDSGAKVSIGGLQNNSGKALVSGEGTTLTVNGTNGAMTLLGDNFALKDKATLKAVNGVSLYFTGKDTGSVIEGANVYGSIVPFQGGKVSIKDSVLNAGRGDSILSSTPSGYVSIENSTLNSYYNAWNSSDGNAAWRRPVNAALNDSAAGGGKVEISFKNSVINGAGSADGVGYWDMDPESRNLSSIQNGGQVYLQGNMTQADSSLVLNFESGTKYAGQHFMINGGNSSAGSITVNQGGSDLADGYTRVHIAGALYIYQSGLLMDAADPGAKNSNTVSYNFLGNTEFALSGDLNFGSYTARSGTASINVSGANNSISIGNNFSINGGSYVDEASNSYSNADMKLIFDENSSNSTITVGAGLSVSTGTYGTASIVVDGTNNSLVTLGNVAVSPGLHGTASVKIDGANNTVKSSRFDIVRDTLKQDEKVNFEMLGEGNVLDVTAFSMCLYGTQQDGATGGTYKALFKGSSADNKNKLIIRGSGDNLFDSRELTMRGSTVAGSKFKAEIEIGGNTILRGDDASNVGVYLKLHQWGGKDYTTDSVFTISGSGNDILFSSVEMGNGLTSGGGLGILRVASTGDRIEINSGEQNARFSISGGGMLSYAIQSGGISTVHNYIVNTGQFSGKFEVDFSNMNRKSVDASGVEGGWEKFDLLASISSLESNIGLWFTRDEALMQEDPFGGEGNLIYLTLNEDYVTVIAQDDSDEYVFVIDSMYLDEAVGEPLNALSVYYRSSVPEPAAVAAIFGALALALAAYRRRG